MREADTAYQVFEARVRAERIEAWPQQDARVKSLPVAFFQPIHRLILIPESCIDHGNLRGMRRVGIGKLLQVAQQFDRLAPLAGSNIGASETSYARWGA